MSVDDTSAVADADPLAAACLVVARANGVKLRIPDETDEREAASIASRELPES